MRITSPNGNITLPEFKPFSADQLANPHPVLKLAREKVPVFYAPEFDFWVVTRYEDVNRVYGDPVTFSSASVLSPRRDAPPEIIREFGNRELPLAQQLVMTDPPRHTRLKQLMMPAFLPGRLVTREAWTRNLTNRLVDLFPEHGEIDLVTEYADKIPPAVIGNVVGSPEGDSQQFANWVDDIFTLTGAWDVPEGERATAWRGVFAFSDYITRLIEERRQEPRDDLTSDFINAVGEDGSPAMSDIEVLHNVVNVAAAGADTTSVLIAQLIFFLLVDKDQWNAVRTDRSLIPNAVHEAMRFGSPVRGLVRKTTAEVTMGRVTIPSSSTIFIHLASANRDEAVFANPDRFDVRRSNAIRHLGFGSRAHSCIGANLARMEARIALETLIDRLPDLVLGNQQRALDYKPNLMLPGIRHLWARWSARVSAP